MDTPQYIGKYEILGRLGQGGMAEVFLARRTGAAGFEKKVALKRLGSSQGEDKLLIQSLINEARLVSQLSHQNLVQVLEFELIDNAYCMAMEYIDGITLESVMDRSAAAGHYLPRGLILFCAQEICTGLDYAHSATTDAGQPLHLVHRDIKPSNIMISRRGQIKIMDFGIAKAATNAYKTTTHGGVKGTLAYMSPEQLSGEQNLTALSDLYSFGLILFELATLVRLYDDSNLFKLATDMQKGLTLEAEDRLRSCFAELVPIVKRLLSFHPEDRYPDARSLLYDLRALGMGASALEIAEYLKDMDAVGAAGATAPTVASGVSGPNVFELDPGTGTGGAPRIVRPVPTSGQKIAATEPLPLDALQSLRLSTPSVRPASELTRADLHNHPSSVDARGPMSSSEELSAPEKRGYTRRHLIAAGVIGGILSLAGLIWISSGQTDDPVVPVTRVEKQSPDEQPAKPPTEQAAPELETQSAVEKAESLPVLTPPPASAPVAAEPASGSPQSAGGATQHAPAPPSSQRVRDKERPPITSPRPGERPTQATAEATSAPIPVGIGTLVVSSKPYSSVFVDGKLQKEGPLRMSISSGSHQIRLLAGDGREKIFKVEILPGQTTERLWNFEEQKWME